MSDFEDTDLLYRGPGGEQRKLMHQAERLVERLHYLTITNTGYKAFRFNWLHSRAQDRYSRRLNRYYKQESSM